MAIGPPCRVARRLGVGGLAGVQDDLQRVSLVVGAVPGDPRGVHVLLITGVPGSQQGGVGVHAGVLPESNVAAQRVDDSVVAGHVLAPVVCCAVHVHYSTPSQILSNPPIP